MVANGATTESMVPTYNAASEEMGMSVRNESGYYSWECIRWYQTQEGPECRQEGNVYHGTVTTTAQTSLDYDDLGLPLAWRGNNGQNFRQRYDNVGRTGQVIDSQGRTSYITYDALGRPIKVVDALQGTTEYKYDASDRVIWVRDPKGLQYSFVYDGFGQLWASSSPDTGVTTHQYDAAGLRTTTALNGGRQLSYSYDPAGRLQMVASGIQTRTFFYDNCPNGIGRLCGHSVSGVNVRPVNVSYSYTAEGWVASESLTVDGSRSLDAFAYDAAGRMTGISYPSGVSVGYGYTAGKPVVVQVTLNGVTQNVVSDIKYQPYGPVASWTYGNGLPRTMSRDLDGRLTSILNRPGFTRHLRAVHYGTDGGGYEWEALLG